MSSVTLNLPVPKVRPNPWIISPANDLTWFICSALAGYATILLFKLGVPLTPVLLTFIFLIDGPHVWSTMTRTYLDKSERKKRRNQLLAIVPLFLVGPTIWSLGYSGLFFMLAYGWAYFHHAKQEYGFLMLYKAKQKERNPIDMKLDRHFVMVSLILPYLWYLEAAHDLTARSALIKTFVGVVFSAYGLLTFVYVARQIQKYIRGELINGPKLALLAVSVSLQWYAFGFAIHHPFGILAAAIPINTFHALQYQRLMWFHNRNHYSDPVVKVRAGFASLINKSVVFYLAVGLVTNFAFHAITGAGLGLQGIWVSVFWGVSFTHYFLDSKIWRTRGDKELAAALRL